MYLMWKFDTYRFLYYITSLLLHTLKCSTSLFLDLLTVHLSSFIYCKALYLLDCMFIE